MGPVFQLSTRLPYLPSWGPCHLLFLLSHPLCTRNEAGWFLPRGPHLPLLPRQDSSLLLGGSIFRSSHCLGGHGLQGGARGGYMGRKALCCPTPPLLPCTLGVSIPSCCAHLEWASPPAVHTWSAQPRLLCTLGVRTPACCAHLEGAPRLLCTLGVRTPAGGAHLEWASRPAVHTWSAHPHLLCTLRVGIPACCACLECVSPASVHTWSVHLSPFPGKPLPSQLEVWSGC